MSTFDPAYKPQITDYGTEAEQSRRGSARRTRDLAAGKESAKGYCGRLSARTPDEFGRDQAKLKRAI